MSEQIDFDDELQKFIRAEPFVPFSIIFTSGDRYTVTAAGAAFSTENALIVFQPKSGFSIFRKNEVVGVDVPATGKKRRSRRA